MNLTGGPRRVCICLLLRPRVRYKSKGRARILNTRLPAGIIATTSRPQLKP